MFYKQILTYTISDDDSRESFEELLDEMEFREMPDQSTWALPFKSGLTNLGVVMRIKEWSRRDDVLISKSDFVQIFRATPVKVAENDNRAGIDSRKLVYNSETKGLN